MTVRETLYLRLGNHLSAHLMGAGACPQNGPTTVGPLPVEYCISTPAAVAAFDVRRAPLAELAPLARQRRVVVLVPAADVRLLNAQVPARQAAKALQAAPFALEDLLADEVDTLHFAIASHATDGQWPLAIVTRERMQFWLDGLAANGLRPDAMYAETHALPLPDGSALSGLLEADQVWVRNAANAGFVCARDELALYLSIADPQRQTRLRLQLPRDAGFDASQLDWPVELLHGHATPLAAMIQQLHQAPIAAAAINLLQGEFSPQGDLLRHLRPWRLPAALAAAALLFSLMLHGLAGWQAQRAATRLHADNETRFRSLFPQEQRIVDLGAQLDQQIAGLQGHAAAGFLALLQTATEASTADTSLRVQSLQFREGALYVGMRADSLQAVETLKQWFAAPRGAMMDVQSADAGSDGVQIRIRLSAR